MARPKKEKVQTKNIKTGNKIVNHWSWERLVRDASFNKGVDDYKAGFWDHNHYDNGTTCNQWQYERGRHYAAAGGPVVKDGRTTNQGAINFYKAMWHNKELV